jgi:hypothetical protein
VSRGRADAEMIWGEETPGRVDQFEARALPSAERLDLETAELVGVSATSPREDARGEAAGLVDVDASLGDSSWRRRLAPRHREAVREFFSDGD